MGVILFTCRFHDFLMNAYVFELVLVQSGIHNPGGKCPILSLPCRFPVPLVGVVVRCRKRCSALPKVPFRTKWNATRCFFSFRKVFKNPILQKEIIHEEYKGPTPRMPPFSQEIRPYYII